MIELHPLAKYYNTPEQYQRLKNFVDAHNRQPDIDFNIDEKSFEKEMQILKNKLDKSIEKVFK